MPFVSPENVSPGYKGNESFGLIREALNKLVPNGKFMITGANPWDPSSQNSVGRVYRGVTVHYDTTAVEAAGLTQKQLREAVRQVFKTIESNHALATVSFVKKTPVVSRDEFITFKANDLTAEIRNLLEQNLEGEELVHRVLISARNKASGEDVKILSQTLVNFNN